MNASNKSQEAEFLSAVFFIRYSGPLRPLAAAGCCPPRYPCGPWWVLPLRLVGPGVLGTPGGPWRTLAAPGCSLRFLPGGPWLLLAAPGGFCWPLATPGGPWLNLAAPGGSWPLARLESCAENLKKVAWETVWYT